MLVPEFMQFYGYTVAQALEEYSRTFFSLINAMYRLQAKQSLDQFGAVNGNEEYLNKLRKQERGIHGIVKEVRVARKARK